MIKINSFNILKSPKLIFRLIEINHKFTLKFLRKHEILIQFSNYFLNFNNSQYQKYPQKVAEFNIIEVQYYLRGYNQNI